MRSSHAILDGPLAGPADPPFTGLCEHPKCGGELGEYAYRVTLKSELVTVPLQHFPQHVEWKHTTIVYCEYCTRTFHAACLEAAGDYQLDDWLHDVEKITPCSDCGRFDCGCPG